MLGTVQFAFGFFIEPLEEEFGWSRTQVNVSLSIGVVTSFLSPVVGSLMDRFGAKWTMAVSILLVASAFLLRSVMTELWQFYLFSGIMFAGTPGATMMPAGRLDRDQARRIRARSKMRVDRRPPRRVVGEAARPPLAGELKIKMRFTYVDSCEKLRDVGCRLALHAGHCAPPYVQTSR